MLVRFRAFTLAALLLASGCASLAPAPTGDERSWRGRFALTVNQSDNSEQRRSGQFELSRASSGALHMNLTSGFGTTLAVLTVDRNGAALTTADGQRSQAGDAEQLSEQLLGWRIPIERLPRWLDGDGPDAEKSSALQDGPWTIRYDEWSQGRPVRLTISYPQRVLLRLVLHDP